MTTDARSFHAVQFFNGVSDESIRALALDGGYMAVAAKQERLQAQNNHLREQLADLNAKAQRVLQRLPS
jgi:hypothetical protein